MIIREAELISKLETIKPDASYVITVDKKGNPNVAFTAADGCSWPIHSRYDCVREADGFAEKKFSGHKNIILLGCGLGYAVKSFIRSFQPDQRLYVFETNLQLLRIAFERIGLLEALHHESVLFYAADSFDEILKDFYAATAVVPTSVVTYLPSLLTMPESFRTIKGCYKLLLSREGLDYRTLSADEIKAAFNYKPITRKREYRIIIIDFHTCLINIKTAFDYLGHKAELVTLDDLALRVRSFDDGLNQSLAEIDLFIGCNAVGLETGIFDHIEAPYFSIGVDHAYHLGKRMNNSKNNAIYGWCDSDDTKYADLLYFKNGKNVFLAHSAEIDMDCSDIFIRERPLDVVIANNHEEFDEARLKSFAKQFDPELIIAVAEYYKTAEMPLEFCAKKFLGDCDDQMLFDFMLEAGMSIDQYVREYKKYRTLKALSDIGIRIDVFGFGWENSDLFCHPNLIFHGFVSFEAVRRIFQQTKIVVNSMPTFFSGSHERIFSAAIHGTLCLTDRSTYFEKNFSDGKNIVFYDRHNLNDLTQKVKYYLEHAEERRSITKAAFEHVRDKHTWINRAEEILDIYEQNNPHL